MAASIKERLFFLVNSCDFVAKMAVEKIHIEEFLELAKHLPVFDVRSPGEFYHANIPGAYSLPLF